MASSHAPLAFSAPPPSLSLEVVVQDESPRVTDSLPSSTVEFVGGGAVLLSAGRGPAIPGCMVPSFLSPSLHPCLPCPWLSLCKLLLLGHG